MSRNIYTYKVLRTLYIIIGRSGEAAIRTKYLGSYSHLAPTENLGCRRKGPVNSRLQRAYQFENRSGD